MKNLRLNRETLRNLDRRSMKRVNGGIPPTGACPLSNLCVTNIIRQTSADTLGPNCIEIGYTKVCA